MKKIMSLFSPYRGLPKEVYVIFVAKVINAMGCFVMPMLTFILTVKIGMSRETAGAYMTVWGVLCMLTSVIGGKLVDSIGRKRVIVLFDSLGILMYIVCGFLEPSMSMVFTLTLAGVCMSIAGPAYDPLIADITTPANRDGAYALSYLGWNLGYAIGPIIAGMLFEKHLQLLFWGDAFTALIAVCLIGFFIKETIGKTKEDIVDESRQLEKSEKGSVFSVLMKRPILIYFSMITFWYAFAYSQWGFLMPLHAEQNFVGLGAKYFGWMGAFNGFIVIAMTPILTKLVENVKSIRRCFYGGILYAVGFGLLGVINTLPFFFVSVLVFTLGEIILSISIMPFIINQTPASHRGRVNSVLGIISGIGYNIGPACSGIAAARIGIESSWIIVGILVFTAALFMRGLERQEGRTVAVEAEVEA